MKMNPVVHFEMPVEDKARVKKFYETVFGWQMQQMGQEMGEYILASTTEVDEKTQQPKTPGAINGGFILGGAVSKVVASLVSDIINPILGVILGAAGNLDEAYVQIGSSKIMWGSFLNTSIDFLVIAFVVYYGVKWLELDKLDKKKNT